MIYLLVDQVAVQQPDEYRRPALVTLIKSATTKTQREKRQFAGFCRRLPTSDERYSAGCKAIEGFGPLWPNTIELY